MLKIQKILNHQNHQMWAKTSIKLDVNPFSSNKSLKNIQDSIEFTTRSLKFTIAKIEIQFIAPLIEVSAIWMQKQLDLHF